MALELSLQVILRGGRFREYDQARRVAIDAVDDERPAAAAAAQVLLQIVEHRARVFAPAQRQRHGQESGRLVEHDQRVVLVNNRQIPIVTERGAALRAARPVHPGSNDITRRQPGAGLIERHLALVQEDLPALERRRGAHARSNAIGAREKLVEPRASLARVDRPVRHTD